MKARWFLALCALLAFPGCFDPIVGAQCAKGYSRCGNKCVVAGTCTLADAGVDAPATDLLDADADGISEPFDGSEAVEPDAEEDGNTADGEAPTDTSGFGEDADAPSVEDARLAPVDTGTEDAPITPGEDAPLVHDVKSPDLAIDAPSPSPDTAFDTWLALDLPVFADSDNDGGADASETGELDGTDASEEDGSIGLGDADAQESDAEDVEAGPLVCEGSLSNCSEQCVDKMSDPENCGECASICTSGVCNAGECLVCAPDETVCGRACVNTASDPDNCGSCGNPCPSGLCSSGVCEAEGTGRAIVIGHDYTYSRPVKNRLLGNAVFLWPVNPVKLLLYTGEATQESITGADGAIGQVAGTSRQVTKTYGTSASIPTLLPAADVFLIYAQSGASDTILNQLGTDWAPALSTFVGRGGTLIVLDADQSANAGTVQILSAAGLLNLTRQSSASGASTICNVVARGDALVAGMYRTYSCQPYSTTFTLGETGSTITSVVESVVGDAASAPVVISKLF